MKKLVVFYSYTGNTKMIANMIKDRIDCDILELIPKIPYSTDYQTVVDEEQNSSSKDKIREYEDIKINMDDYDEIIVGSPVWWYSCVPIIRTFLKNNDLSNKIVKAYATNAGWLGHTFDDIKRLTNDNVECMNIVFDTDYNTHKLVTDITEIEKWIDTL